MPARILPPVTRPPDAAPATGPAPALFVSHGSPMFALQPGRLGPMLQQLGRELDRLTAILVVSPHWQTPGLEVGAAAAPATIHDFGGFPPPLYALQYRPPGAPMLAAEVAALLGDAGHPVRLDPTRGLDHGVWVPLRYLKPAADVPVLPLSMPHALDAAGALRLGRALAPLRARGVMVVGSGSLTHNLYEYRRQPDDPEYARTFADWIGAAVRRGEVDALVDYRRRAPQAARAHPTEEHYLPLLLALGAAGTDEAVRLDGGLSEGILSMDAYVWGHAPAAAARAA